MIQVSQLRERAHPGCFPDRGPVFSQMTLWDDSQIRLDRGTEYFWTLSAFTARRVKERVMTREQEMGG